MKSTISIFNQAELLEWANTNTLASVNNYMKVIHIDVGEFLFEEGERDKKFYILLTGQLEAHSKNREDYVVQIEPGRAVGETAILTGRPYSATVKATRKSTLVSISQRSFEQLIQSHPEIGNYFNNIITPRIHENYLFATLRNIFGELEDDVLEFIQERASWQTLQTGEVLFEQGARGTDIAIVITGRLQIRVNEKHVADIHHGEMVGEMALLTDEPRSATVKAIRQTTIVRLLRADFEALIHLHPDILMQITRVIIHRQHITQKGRTHENLRSINFAILFLDEIKFDFIIALTQALSTTGTVALFDAERFNKYYGQSGAAQIDFDSYVSLLLNRWLTELEIQNNYVLFAADETWTNWTERCLQNADRVLLVGDSIKDTDLREIEGQLAERFPELRQDLILLHPPDTLQPTGTQHWLEPRPITNYYHIRRGDDAHVMRVARSLSGNAYGLVFSGGGANGLSHMGVIRALQETNTPIDMIGGTSMGALIGAGLAMGEDFADMQTMAGKVSDPKNVLDWTIPLVSFVSTRKVTNLLKSLFGDVRIEDLWVPYFCVSSNLTTFEPTYHQRGLLWRAIRASTAIPVAMSPIKIENELHIDGSIMNNFPVDKMNELIEGGFVIGVMVSPVSKPEEHIDDLEDDVSGWRVLFNRLNPFTPRLEIPSLADTFYRSLLVNSKQHFQSIQNLTDMMIIIEQNKYGYLELNRYLELIELGYEVALPQVKQIPK